MTHLKQTLCMLTLFYDRRDEIHVNVNARTFRQLNVSKYMRGFDHVAKN